VEHGALFKAGIVMSNHQTLYPQTLIPYMPHICQTMYKRFGIISAKPWFVKYLRNVLCRKNCQKSGKFL